MKKNLLLFLSSLLLVGQETMPRCTAKILKKTINPHTSAVRAKVRVKPIAPVKKSQKMSDLIQKAKRGLKHVNPALQNQFARVLLSQKSPYNATLDFSSFITKLRIEDGFVIENKTARKVDVAITYASKEKRTELNEEMVSLKSGELYVFEKKKPSFLIQFH